MYEILKEIREWLVLIADLGIWYWVVREYKASEDTNQGLSKLFTKQRKQKQKVSVDKVIKAAVQETKNG